jgi:hypothetical protein
MKEIITALILFGPILWIFIFLLYLLFAERIKEERDKTLYFDTHEWPEASTAISFILDNDIEVEYFKIRDKE